MQYRVSDFINMTAGLSENYSKILSNFYGDHEGINMAGFTQLEVNPAPRLKLEVYALNRINLTEYLIKLSRFSEQE